MQTNEKYDRIVATILYTDIVDSQSLLLTKGEEQWVHSIDKFHTLSEQLIQQYQGTIVEKFGDGLMATFDISDKAIHCALDFQEQIKAHDIPIRIAIHTGECIKMRAGIGGLVVHIAKQIHKNASVQDILISQTVRKLLIGSDLKMDHVRELNVLAKGQVIKLYRINAKPPNTDLSQTSFENIVLKKEQKNTPFLKDVLRYIKYNIKNPDFGIKNLCDEFAISERQLQRKLKLFTNKSPTQLIRSIRLHYAKDLILQEGMSISDSAYEAGFNSPSYFTKCFKVEFGQSPSEILSKLL